MINDHDRCEQMNVSSGTSSPGLSWTKFRAVKQLCMCVCVFFAICICCPLAFLVRHWLSIEHERKCSWYTFVAYLICWPVSLSVQEVYCGNMADWIQMLFEVVSGVG